MAVIAESDTLKTTVVVSFGVLDAAEGEAMGRDLYQTVIQRLEYHGFHPEGVTVTWDTGGGGSGG